MPEPPVAAIVLAAGQSRRLGQPKQLVKVQGEPLLHRVVRLALEAGCSPVAVVLGACEQPCRDVLHDLAADDSSPVYVTANPDWAEGMSTSLRAGLAALGDLTPSDEGTELPESILVLVTDQVRLSAASITRLLDAHATCHAPVTAARYSGRLGVPAIFRRELLPALAALSGDRGARGLLEEWADRAAIVEMPEAAFELDTPQDLAGLQ